MGTALRRTGETPPRFGRALKEWRERRGVSQLGLALASEVSQRHVSFIEVGRAQPSRTMVLRLCDALNVPLRERNAMLTAAGFAPVYSEHALGDAAMTPVREAVDFIMKAHEPNMVLAVDLHWNVVAANGPMLRFMAALLGERAGDLLGGGEPLNAMRMMFGKGALKPFVANWTDVAAQMLQRLRVERDWSGGDKGLSALYDELRAEADELDDPPRENASPLLTIALDLKGKRLTFFTTLTMLTTPHDIMVEGLRVETFFPADQETRAAMAAFAA